MIDLYFWTTPNGYKPLLFLEEAGLDYRIVPVDIGRGEQFEPEFLEIAPNNRIPALFDHAPAEGREPISVFESGNRSRSVDSRAAISAADSRESFTSNCFSRSRTTLCRSVKAHCRS